MFPYEPLFNSGNNEMKVVMKKVFMKLMVPVLLFCLIGPVRIPTENAYTYAFPFLPQYQPGSQEELIREVGWDRIFFDYQSVSIRPDQRYTVDKLVTWLHNHPNVYMWLEGHASENEGSRDECLPLGERRAESVKEYLVERGVSSSRLSTISYGRGRPAVVGDNENYWVQNRRVMFVVR